MLITIYIFFVDYPMNHNHKLSTDKPYFNCDDKMKTKLGYKNYSISCVVHALPDVKDTKIFLVNADKRTQLIGEGV